MLNYIGNGIKPIFVSDGRYLSSYRLDYICLIVRAQKEIMSQTYQYLVISSKTYILKTN